MNVEVTSVSKKKQSIADAPAAVTVISQDEISLAEITVQNRLPVGREIEEIDGLVVVAPSADASPNISLDLVKLRVDRALPILAIAADASTAISPPPKIAWRTSIPLSELVIFIESFANGKASAAA